MNGLSDLHERHILSTFMDLHRRMSDLEAMISQAHVESPFNSLLADLAPSQEKTVRDYFQQIRAEMHRSLNALQIPVDIRRTSLRWGLQTGTTFLSISLAGLSASELRGYGAVDAAAMEEVDRIHREIDRLIVRVGSYLRSSARNEIAERIRRIDPSSTDMDLIRLMDSIITSRGLVEFRRSLDAIMDRLESRRFEIAIFGRVSSGKSSLLNRMVGQAVLPVGVTPVTAVPTRIVHGAPPAAFVRTAEQDQDREIPISALAEYVSETGNPSNVKKVVNVLVRVDAPGLAEDVQLVDTPGVGSLALAGAAETYAYLPRCDYAVLLVDAGGAMSDEDLSVLRRLVDEGIAGSVVVSKADLLSPADRARVCEYIHRQLQEHFGESFEVFPVSSLDAQRELFERWHSQTIKPQYARHRELFQQSIDGKVERLRVSLIATLETVAQMRSGMPRSAVSAETDRAVQRVVDDEELAFRAARERIRTLLSDSQADVEAVIAAAAAELVDHRSEGNAVNPLALSHALVRRLAECGNRARDLCVAFARKAEELSATLHSVSPSASLETVDLSEHRVEELPAIEVERLEDAFRFELDRLTATLGSWGVRRAIRKRFADALQDAIWTYGRRIDAWATEALGRIHREFEGLADIARSPVRRFSGSADLNGQNDVDSDLETLRNWPNRSPVPVASQRSLQEATT